MIIDRTFQNAAKLLGFAVLALFLVNLVSLSTNSSFTALLGVAFSQLFGFFWELQLPTLLIVLIFGFLCFKWYYSVLIILMLALPSYIWSLYQLSLHLDQADELPLFEMFSIWEFLSRTLEICVLTGVAALVSVAAGKLHRMIFATS